MCELNCSCKYTNPNYPHTVITSSLRLRQPRSSEIQKSRPQRIREFPRIPHNHTNHKYGLTQHVKLPFRGTPLTHFILVWGFRLRAFLWLCKCACMHLSLTGLAWLVRECEQRVERFLFCLREIAVCCMHLTSFNPTGTFKRPCKTASPSGSCTHMHYHNVNMREHYSSHKAFEPPCHVSVTAVLFFSL